ncbi:MAG: hypothetical protein IT523_08255 [Burkholderiales bacterium]|nr:hypothetical protein [Burkholderiales bacterium]
MICAACGTPIARAEPHYDGIYVTRSGQIHPHHICERCAERARDDAIARAEIAGRVELHFADTEGRA